MRPSVEHKKLHQENILDYLNQDRKGAKRHCDRVLQSEGKNYSVHESILGAASDYFRTMFDVEKNENNVCVVPVDKIPPDRLENILDYAYLGDIEVTEDNVIDVLEDAEHTQMKDLKAFCQTCMPQIVSVDNCLKLRAYAQRYNLDDVVAKSNQIIAENFTTVLKQEDFMQLKIDDISTIIEQRPKTCEEAVFTGIMQWVNRNPLEREELFVNLFSQLDLTLLSTDFLSQVYKESLVQNSLVCNKMLVAALLKPSNSASNDQQLKSVLSGGFGSVNAGMIYDVNTKQFRQLPDSVYHCSLNVKESELEPKVTEQGEEQADVKKRVYDRNFIMKYRYQIKSMEKPRGLPSIEDMIREKILEEKMGTRGGWNHSGTFEGWTRVEQKPTRYDPSYMKLSKIHDEKMVARGGRKPMKGGNDEGWTKNQQKPTHYDPNNMKLSKTQFDEATVTLGPTRGKLGWRSNNATQSGTGVYSSRNSTDSSSTPQFQNPTTMNRFSALGYGSPAQQEPTSTPNHRVVPSRHPSRVETQSWPYGLMAVSPTARDTNQTFIDTTARFATQDPKLNLPALKSTKIVTEEVMKTKCKSVIEEYLCIIDLKEAQECLLELPAPATMYNIFVRVAMQLSLEKTSIARKNVSKLMVHLLFNNTVSVDEYIKGVLPVITEAMDLELDLPKVWECLAEQIAPVLGAQAGGTSLLDLYQLMQPLREEEKTHIFVAEVLKQLVQQTNVSEVLKMWNSCKLNWTTITSLSSSLLCGFLEKESLQMFSPQELLKSDPRSKMQLYESNITKLLNKNKNPDKYLDAIELIYSSEERIQATFIRALTVSICRKVIKQGDTLMEMDKMVIKRHILLLKKCIDTEDKELEAVFALQRLWVVLDQPPNILKLLFDSMYDEEIISKQTFFKWERDQSAAESEGKGVALLSVNPFFTWLRNADPESDD